MDIKVENFQGRLTKQYPNIYATLIKGDALYRCRNDVGQVAERRAQG